jgi:hypothetical protein
LIATDSTGPDGLKQWRIVFWIAFVIFNVTNVVYIIWASAEIQPFNDGIPLKSKIENEDSLDDSENSNEDKVQGRVNFDEKLVTRSN